MIRLNTDRPVTIMEDSNRLCSNEDLKSKALSELNGSELSGRIPNLLEGKTAQRVDSSIAGHLQ